MNISGPQIGELTEMVVRAFSRAELKMLVRVELDMDLATEVATDEGWRPVVFEFIDGLNRKSQVIALVRAVRKARPNDTDLGAWCDTLLLDSDKPARPASEIALRKAITAFNKGFHDRGELFKYLNAYKGLHDVLHELQSNFPNLKAAIEARVSDSGQPLAEEVVFFLEEHLAAALDNARDVEFPDKPPGWIARMSTAVELIKGGEVDKMVRQVERLKSLPSDNLAALNEKLFENASRLQPRQLTGALNEILAALGEDGSPARRRLRADVKEFRDLCAELDDLINAHNLCQRIDDSLREAAGLPSVTPAELSEWPLARKSLDELASHRKADKRVQRTNEAARLFESANQAQAFRVLVERFDDLFTETDKALLKVTNKLPRKAMALHTALETV
jgi:hypothetical protein